MKNFQLSNNTIQFQLQNGLLRIHTTDAASQASYLVIAGIQPLKEMTGLVSASGISEGAIDTETKSSITKFTEVCINTEIFLVVIKFVYTFQ